MAIVRREFSAGLDARLERMRSALAVVAHGYEAAMAETFYHAAHSLTGPAASVGADELVEHAAFLADLGRRWLHTRAVTGEQLTAGAGELERLGLAVEQYKARIELSDAE